MKHIVFKYKDKYTRGEWSTQECWVGSLKECVELYGLGEDCEYEIIKIEDVN